MKSSDKILKTIKDILILIDKNKLNTNEVDTLFSYIQITDLYKINNKEKTK